MCHSAAGRQGDVIGTQGDVIGTHGSLEREPSEPRQSLSTASSSRARRTRTVTKGLRGCERAVHTWLPMVGAEPLRGASSVRTPSFRMLHSVDLAGTGGSRPTEAMEIEADRGRAVICGRLRMLYNVVPRNTSYAHLR